jgi:hypothetical protein
MFKIRVQQLTVIFLASCRSIAYIGNDVPVGLLRVSVRLLNFVENERAFDKYSYEHLFFQTGLFYVKNRYALTKKLKYCSIKFDFLLNKTNLITKIKYWTIEFIYCN